MGGLHGHQHPNAVVSKPDSVNIDHIPVATMQIRALQLLAEGTVSVQDVFGRSAKYNNPDLKAQYGVSTHKGVVSNFDEVKRSSERLANIDLPSCSIVNTASWFSINYTKQLLQDGYGSGNESSDGNYSDDDLPNSPFI